MCIMVTSKGNTQAACWQDFVTRFSGDAYGCFNHKEKRFKESE